MARAALLLATVVLALGSSGCGDAPARLREALPALRVKLDRVRCGEPPVAAAGRPKLERIAGMNVWFPEDLPNDASYDLVVHFHGHPMVVADGYRRAGVRAAVAIVNMGVSSASYDYTFSLPARFEKIQRALRKGLERRGFRGKRRRLVLSSFSAGYAAIRSLLRKPAIERDVDAVIMLDGIHASLSHGEIHPPSIAPFVRFAGHAARGDKLMVLTHSQIDPFRYAGTGRTIDALLEAVHATAKQSDGVVHARAIGNSEVVLERTREAKRGALHVSGFEGNDADAHSKHLLGAGEIAFGKLARHWRCPGPETVASVNFGARAAADEVVADLGLRGARVAGVVAHEPRP
jgi:hypothetical protein